MNTTPSHKAKARVRPIPKPERDPKPERKTLYTFGHLPDQIPECWLAQFSGVSCSGRIDPAHLIREQVIRREVSRSKLIRWAPAVWRPACRRHHSMFDVSKTLRIPREAIPAETEAWAKEHRLGWWLDRTYGERA